MTEDFFETKSQRLERINKMSEPNLEEEYFLSEEDPETDEYGDYDDDEKQEWPEIGPFYTPPNYDRDQYDYYNY